jgi:hypothetical protein
MGIKVDLRGIMWGVGGRKLELAVLKLRIQHP